MALAIEELKKALEFATDIQKYFFLRQQKKPQLISILIGE